MEDWLRLGAGPRILGKLGGHSTAGVRGGSWNLGSLGYPRRRSL